MLTWSMTRSKSKATQTLWCACYCSLFNTHSMDCNSRSCACCIFQCHPYSGNMSHHSAKCQLLSNTDDHMVSLQGDAFDMLSSVLIPAAVEYVRSAAASGAAAAVRLDVDGPALDSSPTKSDADKVCESFSAASRDTCGEAADDAS